MSLLSIIFLCLICFDFSLGSILKGYHFNPFRKTDYQIPVEDMKMHADDPQSNWSFNFKKYGNCIRPNIQSFKLPRKFTFCWKHNHDFSESMNFINLVGSSHGKSILDDFDNNVSWRKMRGEYRMVNFINLHRNNWGTVWHQVHEEWAESNGLGPFAGQGWDWYKWEHWCVAVDFEAGQVISYVNGIKDGDDISGDEKFMDPLNKANEFSFEEDMITDVLIGCNFFDLRENTNFRSMGRMTEFHLFDRILTVNEMIEMTTPCGGKKIEGNLINFKKDTFSIYGDNTKEIEISTEEWCPERPISATFFPDAWTFPTTHAKKLCKKIKRSVIAITDDETFVHFRHFLTYMANGGEGFVGWIFSNVEKNDTAESGWADPITGNDSILPWGANHPMDGAGFTFTRIDYWGGAFTRSSQSDGFWGIAFCVSKDPNVYIFRIKLLGLCLSTIYDYRYAYHYENAHTYIGKHNSTIQYRDGENWIFTSRTDQEREGPFQTIINPASRTSLALGTYNVPMPDDLCTKGKKDKMVKLTITACEEKEFTCFDGNCVPFEQRCNRIVDCPDSSDERDCLILKLDKNTYVKEYPPVTVDDNYNLIKVPVNISIEIIDILDINEVEGNFEVSFMLHQTWYDDRHTYVNLKAEADLNTLTSKEKDDMWKPFIVFSNTKTQETVVTDEKVIARIGKQGEHEAGDRTEAIKSHYFKGKENTIMLSRIYDISFICEYDMAWYPFDVQTCELTMQPFGNTGKYISLVRDEIQYQGKLDLSKYYIKQWKFIEKDTDTGDGVEGLIFLGRRLLSILTTVYIPTILLNIIGHIANYFKPFYFESAIALNLTVMLVLASMYIAVVDGLPVTSYIKMIETWLLFNLIIPFVDVCVCCYVDYLRTKLDEEKDNDNDEVPSSAEPGQEGKAKEQIDGLRLNDYFDFAFQPELADFPKNQVAYEDLVNNDEQIQDSALNEYYAKAEVQDGTELKIMKACIFFSRTVKPIIILIFVFIYWGSGLYRTNQIE